MLAHQKTLRILTIAGYLSDQSAAALANTLKTNQTLTHITLRQNSYCHGTNPTYHWLRYTFRHRYMTDQGVAVLRRNSILSFLTTISQANQVINT
jgi:hypothetical protein